MAQDKEWNDAEQAAEETLEGPASASAEEQNTGDALVQALEQEQDRRLRLMADFENFRRRTTAEMEGLQERVTAQVVVRFLPVLDNLQRALEAAKGTHLPADGLREGVELTVRQFTQLLTALGVSAVPGVGAPFDPNVHEAVGAVEAPGHAGEVMEVLQNGYLLGGRVLRAAMVRVGQDDAQP